MRNVLAAFAALLALAIAGCGIGGGSSGPEAGRSGSPVAKVEVSESRGFGSFYPEPFVTYEGESSAATIERIAKAIREAEKQPGIVNVAEPKYDVRLTSRDGSTAAYHLWLDARYEHATIMDAEETHYIYRISAESTADLLEIIGE
ncbi:hypothetical protein [Paenibacillus sp.]|uniref:hypothetical protein n=1 Tax=Paenibacillus sp. TaxID=58172 RepID=UPI002810F68B|nr:hypothetical protein [Paenibacillus sp.]